MNEIISEMKLMEQLMGKGNRPTPTYFYLQGYGKELKNDVEQLAEATGNKKTLVFDRAQHNLSKTLIEDYSLSLERNKSLGQEFEGLVLVDFTGLENEEIPGFIEYLSNKRNKITYIFTMQDSFKAPYMKKLLENHFFIREIEAKPYSAEEQYAAIQDRLKQFECSGIQITVDVNAKETFLNQLEQKEWEKGESVLLRLENAISAVVYEHLVSTQSKQLELDGRLVSEMFKSMEDKPEKKRRIGFAVGGFENE